MKRGCLKSMRQPLFIRVPDGECFLLCNCQGLHFTFDTASFVFWKMQNAANVFESTPRFGVISKTYKDDPEPLGPPLQPLAYDCTFRSTPSKRILPRH